MKKNYNAPSFDVVELECTDVLINLSGSQAGSGSQMSNEQRDPSSSSWEHIWD